MKALELSTFAHESAVECSNVEITLVLSFATRALVAAVVMPFSTKSAVPAAARSYTPLYHAGRSNRPAATIVRDGRDVGILKWFITAMVTTKLVRSALS